jgi:hypothetical protein
MADLHGAGVGAQHMRRAIVALVTVHIEGVEFLPRGVLGRDVQGVEVIKIVFNLRALGD